MSEEEVTIQNIAKRLKTSKQNINTLLPRLEDRGYINRHKKENCNKTYIFTVTPLAKENMSKCFNEISKATADIFSDFTSEEIDTFFVLIKKCNF